MNIENLNKVIYLLIKGEITKLTVEEILLVKLKYLKIKQK